MVKFTVNGAWQASRLPGRFGKPGLTGNLILCISPLATKSYHLITQKIGYPGRSESHSYYTWVGEGVGLSFIQHDRIVGSFLKIWDLNMSAVCAQILSQ